MAIGNQEIIGEKFTNSQGLTYTVIEEAETIRYKRHFIVRFDESGYETKARLDNIKIGNVRDKTNRTCINLRRDPNEFIGFSGVTKLGDPFEVIEYAGKRGTSPIYKVRFTNTGSEKVFEKGSIKKCLIRDPLRLADNIIGHKNINSQGERYEVIGLACIKEGSQKMYNVRFEETGYVKAFYKSAINNNEIKDPYKYSFLGVACLGEIKITKDADYYNEYILWKGILNRCYNTNHESYKNYGAKGVTVCERWRCFEYFLEDLPLVENYNLWKANHELYSLDKDLKQQNVPNNQKVYSLETCIFISVRNNLLERNCNSGNRNYIGVEETQYDTFTVSINGDYFGTFNDPIAAANMYNHVANYRQYPKEYLNDVPYMSRLECSEYRSNHHNAKKNLIYILDKQRYSDRITDISDLPPMINIKDSKKYYNL